MPLLFHDQLAREERNPQILANRLARHYPLLEGPELSHLPIDDLLYRTLVMLLFPELAADAMGAPSAARTDPLDSAASRARRQRWQYRPPLRILPSVVFSRDILTHFGVRPSELLRDARRHHDEIGQERDGGVSGL
ncbi:MAG: hypothetical protein ACKN89_11030 [Cyanobium sp.]|jgi:hypothetical protein